MSLPENSGGTGSLSGQHDDWTVRVKGDVNGELNKKQQFTVAHELAHALFLSPDLLGGPGPCSEKEYWILEKVCDRIARILLAEPLKTGNHIG